MGCSNIKGAKEYNLIKKNQIHNNEISINPHNEDEIAEQINPGKSTKTKKDVALDELTKTTLVEPSLQSKTFSADMIDPIKVSVVHHDHSVNLKKIPAEKPNFEIFDHKFDFDLDLEISKISVQDKYELIEEVFNDLKPN